jgi:hypothetical protein
MRFSNTLRASLLAFVAMLFASEAYAQVVVQQPQFVAPRTVVDLGNGPTEILPLVGNGFIFTSQGSATGTAAGSTALTLTATPAVPPIVGGFITCNVPTNCTIPASTTVTAYNGTTGVTLSASSTITAAVVNFGAACPVSTQASPVTPSASFLMLPVQVNEPFIYGVPFFTQARMCAYGGAGPGLQMVNFAIGAH